MTKSLKIFLLKASLFFNVYIRNGFKMRRKYSFFYTLNSLRKGFWPDNLYLYRNNWQKNETYVTDLRRVIYGTLVNFRHKIIVQDKLLSDLYFDNSIKNLGLIYKNKILSNGNSIKIADFKYTESRYILKPRIGSDGSAIHLLEFFENEIQVDYKKITKAEFSLFMSRLDNYLIYPFFNQTGFSNAIFPKTLNTIRIMSIVDPETNTPILVKAMHRFGTEESKPVDNWAS